MTFKKWSRILILYVMIFSIMVGAIPTPNSQIPNSSATGTEFEGCITFGDNNYDGMDYNVGDEPFDQIYSLYKNEKLDPSYPNPPYDQNIIGYGVSQKDAYPYNGQARIIDKINGHKNVLEVDAYENGFMNGIDLPDSPATGTHTVELWWAWERINAVYYGTTPRVFIKCENRYFYLQMGTETPYVNTWRIISGDNDNSNLMNYEPSESVTSTILANVFYRYEFTFDLDNNEFSFTIHGEQTVSGTMILPSNIGKVEYFSSGTGKSYFDEHWIDSLSWTWDDEYEEGDLANPVDPHSQVTLEWEDYIGSSSNEIANAIWGNESHIYTAGWSGSVTNAYITKSDSDGNLIWTRTWGGGDWDKAWDIVGDDQFIYVGGETRSNAAVGIYSDLALLKYHANGTLMWYKTWGGSYDDKAFGLFLNGSDIFVVGDTQSSTSVTTRDLALLKYDTDGNFQWASSFNGPLRDSGDCVFIEGENIYTGGITESYGAGDKDLLFVKWDADGNEIWNKTWGGTNADWMSGIWIDNSYVYMSGLTASFGSGGEDAVLIKWDENGNQIWNRTMGNSGNDRFYEICGDDTGIYSGGFLTDVVHGDLDVIVVKWGFNGDEIWNETWGGSSDDYIRAVYNVEDDLYAAGSTRSYGNGGDDCLLLKWNLIRGPQIILHSPIGNSVQKSGTLIDIDVIESSIDTILYNWDGNSNFTWYDPYTTSLPAGEGLHSLYVFANSTDGNSTEEIYDFFTDDTAPIISVTPQSYYSNRSGTEVSVEIDENNLKFVSYKWDSDSYESWAYPYQTTRPVGNGVHTLYIIAEDDAGNSAEHEYIFVVVDPEEPPPDDPFLIPGYNIPILLMMLGIGIVIMRFRMRKHH